MRLPWRHRARPSATLHEIHKPARERADLEIELTRHLGLCQDRPSGRRSCRVFLGIFVTHSAQSRRLANIQQAETYFHPDEGHAACRCRRVVQVVVDVGWIRRGVRIVVDQKRLRGRAQDIVFENIVSGVKSDPELGSIDFFSSNETL